MAGENAVHQKNLLEIVSGAKGARESGAFSADEGVALSHDGGRDSVALETRERFDAGEGLAVRTLEHEATFSAGGGPVLDRDIRPKSFVGGVARVITSRPVLILAAAFVGMILATQAVPAVLNIDLVSAFQHLIGIESAGPIFCSPTSGQSSILSFLSALVCH